MYRFEVYPPPADLVRADVRVHPGSLPYSHPHPNPGDRPFASPGHVQASVPCSLPTGISRLDRFFEGGFAAGQMTLLEGPADFVLHLTSRFAVSGVVAFDKPVVMIDGGNTADPYGFASICRRWHVDPHDVLARIFIARAFTVYQLDSIFEKTAEERIRDLAPGVVIVSALNSMYLDPDVSWDEAHGLFQNDLRLLRYLTERYGIITIITNFGQHPSYHAMELGRSLRKMVSQRIFIKTRSRCRLRVVKNGLDVMDYTPLPPYQCSLDEFFPGGVVDG